MAEMGVPPHPPHCVRHLPLEGKAFAAAGRPLLCGILAAAAVWGLPPGKRDGMIHIKIGGCAVKTGLQTELQHFYCAQNRKQQLDIEPAGWYTKDGQRKAATIEGG